MRTAVHELCQAVGIESHHEIVPTRDCGNARASGERTPLAQQFYILGDVQFVELTTVFPEPILGRFAVGSRRGCVYSNSLHDLFLLRQ